MPEFSDSEQKVVDAAIQFAKNNKQKIAKSLTDRDQYPPEEYPVSIFMAGSPGAGKTEVSKALLESLDGEQPSVLRIDPDELRDYFPDYTGGNSWLFQPAVSLLVERIIDLALKRRQSFLLDGTLTSYTVAEKNIRRCLNRERAIQILYVYQRPEMAWRFGRDIVVDVLLKDYDGSNRVYRGNVDRIDNHIPEKYSRDQLETELATP